MKGNYITVIIIVAVILFLVLSKKDIIKTSYINPVIDAESDDDVIDNVIEEGQVGEFTLFGTAYATKVHTDTNGNRLEWMTENFSFRNDVTPNSFITSPDQIELGASQCALYNFEDWDFETTINSNDFKQFGMLYSTNFVDSMVLPDGWRLPTISDFIGLVEGMYDSTENLCSTTGWEIGLEGTNATGLNFKGGGYIDHDGDSIRRNERAYYMLDLYSQVITFAPTFFQQNTGYNLVEFQSNVSMGSIRFVRNI